MDRRLKAFEELSTTTAPVIFWSKKEKEFSKKHTTVNCSEHYLECLL